MFGHQRSLYEETRDVVAWAVWFEQGLGKTLPTIRTAEHLHRSGTIDGVVVVAPNGVHRNWVSDELPRHAALPWRGLDWHTDRGRAQDRALETLLAPGPGFAWLTITYEAISTARGRQAVLAFKARYPRFLFVVDEASKVSNPTAARTKKVAALRKFASHVRLLNGTPIGNSPLDVYAQIKILDPTFWLRRNIASWTSFRARFAVTRKIQVGGDDDRVGRDVASPVLPHDADPVGVAAYEQSSFELQAEEAAEDDDGATPSPPPQRQTVGRTIEVVVGYRELAALREMVSTISTRLTKEDAGVELPPKLYSRLLFDLPTEQRRAYDRLRREYMLELDSGALVTATTALVRILRLQQVACGYIPNPDDPERPQLFFDDDGKNPRLRLLLERLEDTPHQAIVWARFTHDVDAICRSLGPPRCVRYDGQVRQKERDLGIDKFRDGKVKFCVAKAESMGMGLSLPMAKSVFYFSNTFSYILRVQSEDRSHRITGGGPEAVCYYDLVASRTVDAKILKSLKACRDVANEVTGDRYRAWLEET